MEWKKKKRNDDHPWGVGACRERERRNCVGSPWLPGVGHRCGRYPHHRYPPSSVVTTRATRGWGIGVDFLSSSPLPTSFFFDCIRQDERGGYLKHAPHTSAVHHTWANQSATTRLGVLPLRCGSKADQVPKLCDYDHAQLFVFVFIYIHVWLPTKMSYRLAS